MTEATGADLDSIMNAGGTFANGNCITPVPSTTDGTFSFNLSVQVPTGDKAKAAAILKVMGLIE